MSRPGGSGVPFPGPATNTSAPPLTTAQRLGPGAVLRTGVSAPYRAIEIIDGEPHIVRDDLGASPEAAESRSRPLLTLVHITDLQLADVQSPTRFEFLNRYYIDPRYAKIVPVQRPQEALAGHAVDVMLRTINGLRGPVTGAPLDLAVTTGDAIDNAQWNETQAFLTLFDGGLFTQNSGGPGYTGVQSMDWPDEVFWKPDGPGISIDGIRGPDIFRRDFGFPHYPGLLERAMAEFSAAGLTVPWLSCFGNHEALNQGVGVVTPGIASALTGRRKPLALPDGFDPERAHDLFTSHPEIFMAGPARVVPADPARRAVTRREFVEAHFRADARPAGHGFSEQNRLDGTAYYSYDTPVARLIALDTNCLAGGADGCLDRTQARWLEEQLAEVHSAYRDPAGEEVRTGHEDRLVILFSHHGLDTLTNTQGAHHAPGGEPLLGVAEVLALLHRFRNVVLWLNGHTHINAVRARRDSTDPARGFWEVTTCAIADWPCQTRMVELIETGGQLSIVATMVDHAAPLGPRPVPTTADFATDDLAALHRELAVNVPFGGGHSAGAGIATDRNVDLRVNPPFPLSRLADR